jgi:KTSC domain
MHRIPVTSVDITQIGYQEDSETLEIQFSRGEVCQYYNVPSGVYDELMKSPAKEEYYHTKIGERFPCIRIR